MLFSLKYDIQRFLLSLSGSGRLRHQPGWTGTYRIRLAVAGYDRDNTGPTGQDSKILTFEKI